MLEGVKEVNREGWKRGGSTFKLGVGTGAERTYKSLQEQALPKVSIYCGPAQEILGVPVIVRTYICTHTRARACAHTHTYLRDLHNTYIIFVIV